MSQLRRNVIRAGLEALYFSGAHHWLRPIASGLGAIFMLHHVRPARRSEFQPNRHLEVTPEFLHAVLSHLRATGVEIISMDQLQRRLTGGDAGPRFACLTFDDGYRDNRDHALPVLREFNAPATIYVASDFAQGIGRPWWIILERVIAKADAIEVPLGPQAVRLETRTPAAKQAAFARVHDWIRTLPGEQEVQREIESLCAAHDVESASICRELCLSFDELRDLAQEPLVTIGAHSISHCNLARRSEDAASEEMTGSRARIEAALQRPVLHFAYPYGDRAAAGPREFAMAGTAGFATAVTTRPGMIFPESAGHLTALPRVSLNGHYQDARILPVLTSGAATAMWNGFRRVAAA